jgi:hypothetical protein
MLETKVIDLVDELFVHQDDDAQRLRVGDNHDVDCAPGYADSKCAGCANSAPDISVVVRRLRDAVECGYVCSKTSQGMSAMSHYRDEDVEYLIGYWRNTCRALSKQRRGEVVTKEDGSGRLVLDYPQMGDLLEVAMHADVWRAMYAEDAAAREEASRLVYSRLRPRAHPAGA